MQRRKKYLYSTGAIPTRTLRYQRHKAAQRLAESVVSTSKAAGADPTLHDEDSTRHHVSDTQFADFNSMPLHGDQHENLSSNFVLPQISDLHIQSTSNQCELLSTRKDSCITISSSSSSCSSSLPSSEDEDSDGVQASEVSDNDERDVERVETSNIDSESADVNLLDPVPNSQDADDCPSVSGSAEYEEYLQSPLSAFTNTTRGDALVMCLAIGLQHKLSWGCIVDILKYTNHLFGQEVIKATKYFFQKYMDAGKSTVTYHLYCPYCSRYLGIRDEAHASNIVCHCGHTIKDINCASNFFLSLNLEAQIKELLQDESFLEALQYRFTRKKTNENAFEDIYDGEVYKNLSAPGELLSHWYNMSYMFNTDGFPVGGKSGKQSCWPIYLQINELPPRLRSRYMLLAGIYVGQKDPNMNIFMYPFVQEANFLSDQGINWQFKGKNVTTKIIPLCLCADAPARSKVLNTTAFSGSYGCSLCYTNPESTKVGKRYTISTSCSRTERTHEEILKDAALAHKNLTLVRNKKNRRVRGLKGPAPIHYLHHFNLVKGIRPDPMHWMWIGNAKHNFTVMHQGVGKAYYTGSEVRLLAIFKRLQSIKPPSSVFRSFLNFHNFTTLKARDWRAWLLFYAIPCLLDIIPNEYVSHLSLLSTAFHIVMRSSITPAELDKANTLALRYVFMFEQMYGKEEMVYNIHLITHLKRNILYLGPAWTNAAFGFEGANKELLELKKGASSIAKEIANKYLTFKALPLLCEKYSSSDAIVDFCQNLSGRPLLKSCHRVGEAVLVGKGKEESLNVEEVTCLSNMMLLDQNVVKSFERFLMEGVRYCVSSYNRSSKTDDSFVAVRAETKARILKIILSEDRCRSSIILLVREILEDETPLFSDEFSKYCHIKRIKGEGQLLAIRPQDITGQCVAMFVESGSFICDVPYGCHGDT